MRAVIRLVRDTRLDFLTDVVDIDGKSAAAQGNMNSSGSLPVTKAKISSACSAAWSPAGSPTTASAAASASAVRATAVTADSACRLRLTWRNGGANSWRRAAATAEPDERNRVAL
jgi:hypothetical protein